MAETKDLAKQAAGVARDTAYVLVGLGVLGVQRAQVQRRALERRLRDSDLDRTLSGARQRFARSYEDLDDLVEGAIGQLQATFEPVSRQLPEPLRRVVEESQSQAREVRGRLRQLVTASG